MVTVNHVVCQSHSLKSFKQASVNRITYIFVVLIKSIIKKYLRLENIDYDIYNFIVLPCLKCISLAMYETLSCISTQGCRAFVNENTPASCSLITGRTYGFGAQAAVRA